MSPEDEGRMVVVLGADIARKFDKRPGDTLQIRGVGFEVIGVMEPTLTTPDTTAIIPFEAGQALLAGAAPILARTGQEAGQLVSRVLVYPEADADIHALARAIEETVVQVQATTADDFDQAFGSTVAIFNAIILGVALISLVVGGLSVINTMAMSVAERTREIGIKRSIGASRGSIMGELMTEAAFMGLLGGIIGLAMGAVVVYASNEAGRTSGTILFLLTPWTALFAVAFSTVLGGVAGVVPAWKAAGLDPVDALKYE
jgi:putative ABC transport system permease protein